MLCLKNLFRAKSARFIVTVCASAFIALAAGISFSCSFLEDDGFFDKIEGEVSVANADKMNVYLRYASIKFGKTTPVDAASYQVKNNVAFSVTAVTNSDYAFYRWAAFSTKDFDVAKQHMSMVYANDDDYYANFGSLELDASVVKFENPRAETTNVTVLQTRDDIWIMPVIAVRPTIAGTFPGTSQIPVRNTKLRVQFSKPMDIESFEGNFIISQATRAADFSLNETDISEKFKMEINEKGNLVTFSFRDTTEMFNPAVVVRLYFTDDVADSTGYTMADSKTLEWNIGTYVDTLPPLITEMTAGIGSDCSKFASTPTRLAKTATDDLSNSLYTGELLTHRVKNKINLYVYAQDIAQANGERMESDVLMLGFRAKSITDLEGNAIDGNAEGNFIPNVIDTYAAGQNLSEINGAFRTITGGKSAGCLYTYDLSSLPDGLIQIEVYAVDSTGNDGLTGYDESIDDADGMGNGPRSVFVIKDNRAPAIENELEKIKSSSIVAPFGWYNKLTIDSVEIYDEAANPIRDFGHQKLAAAHENLKWICHLGSSTDWVAEADSADWVPVSERYKIGAAAVDGDGEVSVTIRLMDDLGNISKAMQISSVHCDNTVPETGKIYCVDASGAQGLNSTKDVVVPESMLIKVPFTEELCGVKVFGLTIKASDGKQVENAFEHASILYSVEDSPEKAEAVAIEADTSSLQDVLNSKGNVGASIFPNGIESLHVLQSSYNTGIFYIKNLTLGEADGMYTVTITLYDSALNKAGEKTVMLAHDTMPPVVNRVVIKNVVPRLVYNEEDSTYWLPRSAYDENKDAKYVTVAVTATENGSGVKVITLGENAHITEDTSFIIEGRAVSSDRCTIDAKTNTVTLFDYEQPDLYKQTGSIGFELTNIRLDKPNSEEGNKVSVSLQDFVDNTGSNENAGNFDLYIDDTSTSPIYQVFSDSQIPAIAEKSPALADGKADSATDEKTFAEARLVSVYTDTKNVDLSLKLSPETNGSGVRSLTLSNGLFTGETAVYVDGKLLPQTEYTLDGSIVTFVNYVFTAANTFKFTNVELQGSDDGLQLISITATDFTGWVSKEVSTPMITLDRAAPVVGEVTWHLKEGVYGVSKAAVVSNMDLCLPFTEVMTGVKVLRMDPKLNDSSSSATPFDSADFAIKYISNADIDALAESAGEGGETKPADTATLIENAKLLKAEADYTVKDNYLTFAEPQKYTSGLFVLQNIKVADNFEDNKSYKINLHLADAALNGCAADGTIDLASDSTPPKIQRIFINRLIGRKQPGEAKEDSYWISKEDFEQAGKVPTKVELELTIAESGSGVEKVELGGNLRLTAASEITCGTTKLVKGSDYKVSSDFATITLITNSKPTFRSENGDFTVTITNATLTAEGENKISVKLTDFALNTDPDKSESTKIAYKADSTEIGESVFVDFTAPLLLEGGVKLVDRGGSEAINGTADEEANTVALEGFTNEKLVNVALKTAASDAGETKRSGVKHLVISSGARFTSSSKFYYKDLAAADTAALTHADAATNGEGYKEITDVDISSDNLTASLPYSYACESVCEFIVTNVELTGEEGENQVSIYPVDLTGWSDSEKAVADKITLDTTAPAWGNNANAAAVVMGTVGENGNNADYVWPKTAGARILASDGEVYFYKRPQGSESEPIYLTVNASDANFYGIYYVSDASDKSSSAVAVAAKAGSQSILTKIDDIKFDATSSHEYTILLKDKAGNISSECQSVHVVKDGQAETVNDDDESSSLQNNMEYKESRENYHIFKTSVPKTLTREESDGVDGVSGVSGYAVYYNDGNGGEDGVNPVTIEVNIENHKEKNVTINSGVAYYAINGSAVAPTASLEGTYSAPTSPLQNWNKWIPYSGGNKLVLYPKNDGSNPLCMRLWFKDKVGNVNSIEIKNDSSQNEPDVWICDNTSPQNANGTTDGFVPENNQLSEKGIDFDYMMPDHMWKVGTSAASAELKVMNAAALKSDKDKDKDEGKTENRLFFTDKAKCTLVINNEPAETVATESGNADSENWAVKVFLYPSNSATEPSREVVKTWIKEEANKNKYFYGIPSGSTITLSNIEYPKECSETTPYIYVVAEDRVGNINISKLNVKVTAPSYNSTSNSTYWYGKFIYDKESPEVYLGGTGGTQGSRVNFENFSTAEDIAKLVPYNDGRRPYVDSVNGTTWVSSKTYSLTANSLTGNNTKHIYDKTDSSVKYRMFFYIDVESFAPYAYYYSHDEAAVDNFSIAGNILNVCSPNEKWTILDGTEKEHEEKIPVIIGDLAAMVREASAKELYLHVADKLGRVKTVKMADTKWRHDNTAPTVDFGGETSGLHANDDKGLYRIDAKSKTSLAITFSQEALKKINSTGDDNTVKVYIPHSYITENGSGLYGFSWDANLKDDSPVSVGNPTDGYYLEFTNNTKDSNGSLSISSTTKKFYVFDKVGNSTPIFITSSIDDKPPELTMKFEAHSAALTEKYPDLTLTLIGYDFTEGKIYDASAKSLLDCADSSATPLATSPFRGNNETEGNSEKVGYTKENPYIIYSNAINSEKKFGYIQGTFVAKDQNGTDTTAYSGILTQIIVKRYVITANDSVQTIGTEAKEYPFPIPNKASDSSYTVPMPIYLDGDGDKPTDSVSTGYKGKLYEITVKDSGGNATTVYLKVMRDREAPTFGTKKPKVIGGIGEYNNYFFYNPASACVDPDSLSEFGDSGVGCESKYPILKYLYSGSSTNTTSDSENVGSSNYLLSRQNQTGYYGYYLYAVDYLGNENLVEIGNNKIGEILYVGNTATITSTRNCNFVVDNMKPVFTKPDGAISNYGRFVIDDSTKGTLYYNPDKTPDGENEKNPGKNKEFTITVKAEDKTGYGTSAQTTHRNVVKGFYVSDVKLDLDTADKQVAKADDITLLSGTLSSYVNTLAINIKPSDYIKAGDDTGKVYIYAVDYAKNFSEPFVLSFAKNDAYPNLTNVVVKNYREVDSKIYFNKDTKVTFTINDTNTSIWYYGLYDVIENEWNGTDYSIAKTKTVASSYESYPAGTPYNLSLNLSKFGEGLLDNHKSFDQVFLMIRNWSGLGRYMYLPNGKLPWIYDGEANPPSSVSVNSASENVAFKSNKAGEENKIYYSKNVYVSDDERTFYVDVKFPADPSEIEGYKIQIGDGTLSNKLSFSETTGYSVNETTRKIPIAVPSGTGDTTVKIYAVDGLGNVSAAYSFTISKIEYAPDVKGFKKYDAAETGGALKLATNGSGNLYISKTLTKIKLTLDDQYKDDITKTDKFAVSKADSTIKTDIGFETINGDKVFTIQFGDELPIDSDGTCIYNIYAKNGIGLYSKTPCKLTVIRDTKGPKVSKITLLKASDPRASLNLLEENSETGSSKVNNVYYNNGGAYISDVEADDLKIGSTTTAGSGVKAKYLVTGTASGIATATSMKEKGTDLVLGERNKASSGLYIAAVDEVDNISYTPLSEVEIKVDGGSYVKVNNFVFDNTRPPAPAGVTFSHSTATENNGWYTEAASSSSGKDLNLYYNVSTISVTPNAGTNPVENNLLGFKVDENGELKTSYPFTITLNDNGDVKIYAVDKAGNVSESEYIIHMIEDKTVPAPLLKSDDQINEESNGKAYWSTTEGIVYYKTGENAVSLNVAFTADSGSGIRGYRTRIGSGDLSGLATVSSDTMKVSIDFTGQTSPFDVKIYAVDKTGNINSDTEALKVTFKELKYAPNVTGITAASTAVVPATAKYFPASNTDDNKIFYINSDVSALKFKFTTADDGTGIGIEGFYLYNNPSKDLLAKDENGIVTIPIAVDDLPAEGDKSYFVYAKNQIGLYSQTPYELKFVRDNTGPSVTAITLVAASDGTANLLEETESETSVNNLYFNKSGLKISEVTAKDPDITTTDPANTTDILGSGLGPDSEVKYSLVSSGTLTDEIRSFINTYQYVPDNVNLTFNLVLGENLDSVTKAASEIYIAAIDKVGNIKLTPLSDVDITVGTATEAKKISKFVFDKDAPAAPTTIALTTAAEDLVGSGIYYEVTNADKHEASLYYSTEILGSTVTSIVVTPSPAPAADNDLAGYYVKQDGSEFANLISNTVTIKLSTKAARIYAIDKAGNTSQINTTTSSQRYKITLTNDETAASEISSVRGASGSEYTGTIKAVYGTAGHADYVTAYYSSGFKMKFNVKASNSPVIAYGFTYGNFDDTNIVSDTNTTGEGTHQVTGSLYPAMNSSSNVVKGGVQEFIAKTTGWNVISETEEASLSNDVLEINFPVIDEPYVHVRLWVKDAVGNMTMSGNIVSPAKYDPMDMDKVTWWLSAAGASPSESITYSAENKKLTLEGLSTVYPVKSLEITGFTPSDSGIKVSKVKSYIADGKSYEVPYTGSYDSGNNKYTITFNDNKAYIVKNLEINFDKDGLYFNDVAKVKVNSFDSSYKEYDIAASPKPEYTLSGKTLTITGLWSAYSFRYFSFLSNGISFTEKDSENKPKNKITSVKIKNGTDWETKISESTAPNIADSKYIISLGNKDLCADSIEIVFESVPTLVSTGLKIELAKEKYTTENISFDLAKAPDPEPETTPDPSIFSRLLDNVSAGFTSIFTGPSMTHEEMMALKEAKAEKARARAAEKAAKKAAKKAARDAKKNAEIASASPNQGESWSGLSGEFESASSELDSALAKMKDSSGPEAKASDEVSSKKSIIKVKSERKNAVSNSRNLITDSHVEKSENHDNRMIYIIGFLAVFGVISGIFAKKLLKKRSKN